MIFEFITGEVGSLQFYLWLTVAVISIAGIFLNRLIVSGLAILVYSVNVLAIKGIEKVFESNGLPISKGMLDIYYLLLPILLAVLIVVLIGLVAERAPALTTNDKEQV